MPIMKWGTPPSGNHYERTAHVVGHGEGVALAHAAFGEKVGGGSEVDTTNPNYGPATKWSTAPYKGPKVEETEHTQPNPWGYRSPKRAKKCMANNDTCNGWATESSNWMYCNPHARKAAPTETPTVVEADLFDEGE